jgi:hypothetical protein
VPDSDNDAASAAPSDTPTDRGWLLLIYRVPSEPTRLRAAVWRRIKSLGAIYLQSSTAALPASTTAERALRKLRSEILDMSGTAVLLSCEVLAGEQQIRAAFQAARDDEYEEIVDKCDDFLAQIRKEYVAEHFTYAELEENEVDLVKLKNWLARVSERDVFGATGREPAEKALLQCADRQASPRTSQPPRCDEPRAARHRLTGSRITSSSGSSHHAATDALLSA